MCVYKHNPPKCLHVLMWTMTMKIHREITGVLYV